MTTFNRIFFHSPSRFLIEIVSIFNDYVIIFLLRVLLLVSINIFFCFSSKNFSLDFFENHQLETVWTLIPFLILIFIIFPSIHSLYLLDSCIFCGMRVTVMGHQWYWTYFYKDKNELFFDSYIIPSDSSNIRLLDVDNRLIVPTFLPLRFLVSSSDVIHSWTVPSFGVKIDAVPGRINQFCFSIKRTGIFFGQCSEICGANHSFIPIVIESIPLRNLLKIICPSSLFKVFTF